MTKIFKIGFCLWELMGDHFTSILNIDKACKKEDLLSTLHKRCSQFIDEVVKMLEDNNEDKEEGESKGIGSLF